MYRCNRLHSTSVLVCIEMILLYLEVGLKGERHSKSIQIQFKVKNTYFKITYILKYQLILVLPYNSSLCSGGKGGQGD